MQIRRFRWHHGRLHRWLRRRLGQGGEWHCAKRIELVDARDIGELVEQLLNHLRIHRAQVLHHITPHIAKVHGTRQPAQICRC